MDAENKTETLEVISDKEENSTIWDVYTVNLPNAVQYVSNCVPPGHTLVLVVTLPSNTKVIQKVGCAAYFASEYLVYYGKHVIPKPYKGRHYQDAIIPVYQTVKLQSNYYIEGIVPEHNSTKSISIYTKGHLKIVEAYKYNPNFAEDYEIVGYYYTYYGYQDIEDSNPWRRFTLPEMITKATQALSVLEKLRCHVSGEKELLIDPLKELILRVKELPIPEESPQMSSVEPVIPNLDYQQDPKVSCTSPSAPEPSPETPPITDTPPTKLSKPHLPLPDLIRKLIEVPKLLNLGIIEGTPTYTATVKNPTIDLVKQALYRLSDQETRNLTPTYVSRNLTTRKLPDYPLLEQMILERVELVEPSPYLIEEQEEHSGHYFDIALIPFEIPDNTPPTEPYNVYQAPTLYRGAYHRTMQSPSGCSFHSVKIMRKDYNKTFSNVRYRNLPKGKTFTIKVYFNFDVYVNSRVVYPVNLSVQTLDIMEEQPKH